MVRVYEAELSHKCSKQVWAPLQLKGGGTIIVTNFCVDKKGDDCYSLRRNKITKTYPRKFIRESKPSQEEAQKLVDDYMEFIKQNKSFDGSTTCLKL